jgi:thioredoxin reductase (NADPH)
VHEEGIMSSPSNPNALDANAQAFPRLTPAQIDRIRPLGRIRSIHSGETLFEPNDVGVPFFVVLSGAMDVSRPTLDGERLVTTHVKGCFNGEMATSSGQRCAYIVRRLFLIRKGYSSVILMGSCHSAQTLQLREFFSRNGQPYAYIDLDTDLIAREMLDRLQVKASDVPVVICYGRVLRSPSIQKVADCPGFNVSVASTRVRGVIIVGAGPAGLAAATRATTQAQKFGANMLIERNAIRLRAENRPYQVVLDTGELLATRTIIIATGAQYNRPKLENLARFEGNGIYYGTTCIESQWCAGEEITVVGGGNSAGQAAVFLSH